MQNNLAKTFTVIFLSLFIASLSISVATAQTANVYIYQINHPETWKGKTFSMNGGTYWAGEIHIQYNGSPPSGTHTRAYCMEYNVILYTNKNYVYTVTDAQDNATWRSVSYVLSWYDPPQNNTGAAAVQGAIWGASQRI